MNKKLTLLLLLLSLFATGMAQTKIDTFLQNINSRISFFQGDKTHLTDEQLIIYGKIQQAKINCRNDMECFEKWKIDNDSAVFIVSVADIREYIFKKEVPQLKQENEQMKQLIKKNQQMNFASTKNKIQKYPVYYTGLTFRILFDIGAAAAFAGGITTMVTASKVPTTITTPSNKITLINGETIERGGYKIEDKSLIKARNQMYIIGATCIAGGIISLVLGEVVFKNIQIGGKGIVVKF